MKDIYLTWNIDIYLPTYLFSHLHRVTYPEYLHLDVLLLHVAVDVAAGDARLGPGLVPQDILLEEFEKCRWNIHTLKRETMEKEMSHLITSLTSKPLDVKAGTSAG